MKIDNQALPEIREHIRRGFLVPVTLMLIVLLIFLLFFIERQLTDEVEDSLLHELENVEKIVQLERAEDVKLMKLLLQEIGANNELKTMMRRQDRQALYAIAKPILKRLQLEHSIHHLYFLTPERVTFLRTHQPENHGDVIDRLSAKQAGQNMAVSSAIEFGPLGSLALRVVVPWFDNGQLLGYIELAKGVEEVMDIPLEGTRIYLTLYKRNLVRRNWETGMRLKGMEPDWDRFPSLVLSRKVTEDELIALSGLLSLEEHTHLDLSHEVMLGGDTYRAGTIPIFEDEAHEAGDIVVLTDITRRLKIHREELQNTILAAGGISALLFLFSFVVLGKIERRLETSRRNLFDEVTKREKMREQHVKELQSALRDAHHAEDAALNMMEDAELARQSLQDSFIESIYTLMRAAEYRDDETGAHVRRISYYSKLLAEKMGMDAAFCDQIFYASAMHDIGKIGVPDEILLKPGRLEPEEWEIMKAHTVIGGNILANNTSPYLQMGEQIARYHHERWDGGGYPDGISGESIPLPARIMQLADIYDALRSKRPYKPPFSHAQAVRIICEGDGHTDPSHFDPAVLEAFKACADSFAEIFDQRSEDGER